MLLTMACQVSQILPQQLATMLETKQEKNVLIIDSRSFLEYNDFHVKDSINIGCSKIVKKRLEQNKIGILDLLKSSKCEQRNWDQVIVYDQNTYDFSKVPTEHFFSLVMKKLIDCFSCVCYLQGEPNIFTTTNVFMC